MATLDQSKRIVIKIGSALLVDGSTGNLRSDWLRGLMSDIADQKAMGKDIVIVSSGSIAMGRRVLNLSDDELTLEQSQAAAAVGQIRLAQAYESALSPLGIKTAQILLTLEDSSDRRRYLNSRGTLRALLDLNVVPIVNENDTVATDEIRFGDNDRLAAQVANMAGADMLILLSDVDGLYTTNPREDKTAQHIGIIEKITSELEEGAGGTGSGLSRGGMKTKIMAAKTAMSSGCAMIIMEGDIDRPLKALNKGVKHSLFTANQNPKDARKSWIASMKPKASVTIDAGAISALDSGKSLLAVGVIEVNGQFERGDPIVILNSQGRELAKGLVNYDAKEARIVMGTKTSEIEDKLGYPGRGALVHRDDMVL